MKYIKFLLPIIIIGTLSWGCDETGGVNPPPPSGSIIAVAERAGGNQAIKVGGTEGSVPPGSLVDVKNLNTRETQSTIGLADGSFDPPFMGNTNDIFNVLVTNQGSIFDDVTIGVTLLRDFVFRNLAQLGSFPDVIEILDNRAYVINGGSNNIQIFDLNQNPPNQVGMIVLPPNSNPTAMAFVDSERAYVSNNIGQSVALVNIVTTECEVLIVRAGQGGPTAPCNEVLTVAGIPFEDPSGIAIANGKVYVANGNFAVTPDFTVEPLGPGFVSIINAQTNQFIGTINTTGTLSSGLKVVNNNLYVVNSGTIASDFSTCNFDFPPSVDIIDTSTDTLTDTIDIALSQQNPTVCLPESIVTTSDNNFIYLGLGLVGALFKLDIVNNTVINGPSDPLVITDLNGLNFTAGLAVRDNLLFISLFNSDQIAVLNTDDDQVNPFPYAFPFPAGLRSDNPDSNFFDGVQSIAIRPGTAGIDFTGPDLYFITGLSSQLGSIDTTLGIQ